MDKDSVIDLIIDLAEKIDGVPRLSCTEVPHIVVVTKKITYSVCYFRKNNLYRVFYPFMEFKKRQRKLNFYSQEEVIKYFKK